MGVRGELFSNKVILPNRTYFFNVKENRMGDLYLNIVESKNRDSGGFDRQSVILFADDLQEFLKGFDESLRVLEKAQREKRHSGRKRDQISREEGAEKRNVDFPRKNGNEKRGGGKREGDSSRGRNPQRSSQRGYNKEKRGERSEKRGGHTEKRGGGFSREREDRPENKKRVVVKKRDYNRTSP